MEEIINQLDKDEAHMILLLQKNSRALTSDYKGRDPLEMIDPAKNTAAFLYILNARMEKDPTCVRFVERLKGFRYSHLLCEEFGVLISFLKQYPLNVQQPLLVQLAKHAGPFLTNIHVPALISCLQTVQLHDGNDILKKGVLEFSSKLVDCKQVLLYYYYGGMIFLALKDYDKGIEYLTTTLYAPTALPSEIQLEAYKKLMLAHYIQTGTIVTLPSHLPIGIQKAFQSSTLLYNSLLTNLESFQHQKLQTLLQEEEFKKDGNFGLLKRCVDSMIRYRIKQLTKTYSTLSLLEIEKWVGPLRPLSTSSLSIEMLVSNMIAQGDLFARIHDGMVFFLSDPNNFDMDETRKVLKQHIDAVNGIAQVLTKTDQEIANSAMYTSHTRRTELKPMDS